VRLMIDISALTQGGQERQVLELAAGLRARGHQVLLVVNKHVVAYQTALLDSGIDFVELGHDQRLDLAVAFDLLRVVRDYRPTVCLCVSFNATFHGRIAALVRRVPVVTAEHATRPTSWWKVRWTNRMLGPATGAVVACAHAQVSSLVRDGNRPDRLVVIPNGVDARRFHPDPAGAARLRHTLGIPEHAFVVGIAAEHRPEKRHDRFGALMEGLHVSGLEAWGCVAGDGPLLEQNRARLTVGAAGRRIRVLGFVSDMPQLYSACDAVVLVSDSIETFPMCLLEAQACGVPVVAMDFSGVRETFLPGETGFLAEPNGTGTMVARLVDLARDESLRTRMGEAARAYVIEQQSVDAMVDRYERLLTAVASGTGRGAFQ
jgi:glycosyltransferase involved in cell wall biosynthesis